MQSLIGGADCSTSSNPLKQVVQREGIDNSLFRDRLTNPAGPSGSQVAFRQQSGAQPFSAPQTQRQTPHPFNLSHLSDALSQQSRNASPQLQPYDNTHLEAQWGRSSPAHVQSQSTFQNGIPQIHPAWRSGEIRDGEQGQAQIRSDWSEGYMNSKGKSRTMGPSNSTLPPQQALPPNFQRPHIPTMPYQPTFQPIYSNYLQQQPQPSPQTLNHLNRTQADQSKLEEAFERALADAQSQNQSQSTTTQPAEPEETIRESKGDLEAVWESLRPEAERLGKLAEWEAEFSQFVNEEDDLFETLNDSLNRDDVGQMSLDEQLEMGIMEGLSEGFDVAEGLVGDDGLPVGRSYDFVSSNKFDSMPATTAWAEGVRIMGSSGSLSDAAMLVESFIRRSTPIEMESVNVSEVEVWSLLGRIYAMNENEEKALSAFEQGRRLLQESDRGDKAAGEMLTSLAISYVNESLDLAALTTLHHYLTLLHPTHAGPVPSRKSLNSNINTSPWSIHQEMTDSFLSLAKEQYRRMGQVDPDVQVGLGTLYYMMGEFGEARDCWVAALGERPDDFLLWNRLGATLANGGNPEEAVDAYRKALDLKPTFTRAIFNLGVACLNIGVHREAAEHFLAALSLTQRGDGTGGNEEYSSIYGPLRRALVGLNMNDLAERLRPGVDLEIFRQAGFEF